LVRRSAISSGANTFVTTDSRQAAAARDSGFGVIDQFD